MFNINVEITSGIKEKANTKEPKYSDTKYQYATGIEKRITNTEIITNKQEGKIQEIIEEQQGATSKMNLLESTINETKRTISDFQSETNNKMAEFIKKILGQLLTVGQLILCGNHRFCRWEMFIIEKL